MFFTRLVRRLVHFLTTQTGSGMLYEIDTLRSDLLEVFGYPGRSSPAFCWPSRLLSSVK